MQFLVKKIALSMMLVVGVLSSLNSHGANFVVRLEQYKQFKQSYPEESKYYVLGSYSGLVTANMWAKSKLFCLPEGVRPASLDPFSIIDLSIDNHIDEFPTVSVADLLMYELFRLFPCTN